MVRPAGLGAPRRGDSTRRNTRAAADELPQCMVKCSFGPSPSRRSEVAESGWAGAEAVTVSLQPAGPKVFPTAQSERFESFKFALAVRGSRLGSGMWTCAHMTT